MPTLKKPNFRLVKYAIIDAATNMAMDEAILEAHLNSLVPPTLRLYQFSPPAVSLGYAQNIDDNIKNKILSAGIDVVRRPTGGRAVLHLGDLTYAFICSSKGASVEEYILVDESIATAYQQICQALILFLDTFGINVTFGYSQNSYKEKNDCFSATTIGDLQYKDNKLIGSAQLRRKHAVLQHGSIILKQPQTSMHELFDENIPDNFKRHANFYEITKYEHSITELEKELVKAFQKTFNCRFLPQELTTYEQKLANKLKSKYQSLVRN
jgi:lipoate-protein ligase A